ncbi:hypothetical protein AB1Y20_013455 [Prymnesium parvum]|uniref:Protein xylosyltransferase n=1 Tax=Prymnesium parvum TaxID=97485 RepID=A0AB34IFM6_PRYPA
MAAPPSIPPSIPPTRVAFCYPGTYRESRRAMGSHLRMASQLEAAGAAVSIFAFVAPPINVTLLHSSWGHRVRQLVNMTAEDTLDEARVISEASRKPFAEKGQLSQWYKMYRLWQLLEAEERRVELEYDVVFKMRFDHDVSLYGTDGTHALRAMLRERDAIWHAGTDYCFMGHRAAMKLLFRAIIDGACSAHRPQNSTLHYGGEVMGRTGYDLDWAKDHILYPVEATRWDSGLAFLQRLVNQSTTIVMSYDRGEFACYDRYAYFSKGLPSRWVPMLPQEHSCYSESMMAMTSLQHNLAFYDAGKTQPPLVIDRQNSQDWYVMYHPGIRINLDSCRGQPSNPQLNVEGVDRINSVDAKLYDRPPGHLQVRANAYVLKTSGMNTAEFTQKHILPNLQCPPAPPSPLSTAPSVELLRAKRKELSQLNRIGLHNLTKRHSHLSSPQSNLTSSERARMVME